MARYQVTAHQDTPDGFAPLEHKIEAGNMWQALCAMVEQIDHIAVANCERVEITLLPDAPEETA